MGPTGNSGCTDVVGWKRHEPSGKNGDNTHGTYFVYILCVLFCFLSFFSHFYFPASGQAVVTGVVPSPPRFLPSIFIAHRVQQSHCS